MMNVFICWSGSRGLVIAEVLQTWLQQVFSGCLTVRVSTDIEKGAIWREELEKFLRDSRAGLLCLTPEALESPWVSFEAGFLARAIGAVVRPSEDEAPGQLLTFLLGAKASDLSGPLAIFQSTDANDQRDTERLVKALLRLIPQQERINLKLIDEITQSWPTHWANLCMRFAVIPKASFADVYPHFAQLFWRKTFEEPIDECVSQDWLARFCGARDTLATLKAHQPRIESACREYTHELFHALISSIDAYANALSRLIGNRYEIGENGKLRIEPPGLTATCEKRRCGVRRLVARLEDQPPFFDEAVRFDAAENLLEAKNLIHRTEPGVRELSRLTNGARLDASWPESAACFRLVRDAKETNESPRVKDPHVIDLDLHWRTSRWAFDRVMYGVYLRGGLELASEGNHREAGLAKRSLEFAEEQLDITRAQIFDSTQETGVSELTRLIPLQCALAALEAGRRYLGSDGAERIRELAQNVLLLPVSDELLRATAQCLCLDVVDRSSSATLPASALAVQHSAPPS